MEHALAEVAGRLEGDGNVWGGEIVCGNIEMEFEIRKLWEAGEHRINEWRSAACWGPIPAARRVLTRPGTGAFAKSKMTGSMGRL